MTSTRGILRPRPGLEHFQLDRTEPPDDLRALVGALWTVQWDLPQGTTFDQEVLPFPRVNLAFENGTLNVHGPTKERFITTLKGKNWVAGARFHPAGFFALSRLPMRKIAEAVLSAAEATGHPAPPFPSTPESARAALVEAIRAARKDVDLEVLAEVNAWVDRAQEDRDIAKASDLAKVAGVSTRSLHRALEKYVGVSSKWIVQRARIQQCAELVADGQRVDWSSVAQKLGYHDQAHLIRDFKSQIGFSPSVYAKQCAARRRGEAR